MSGSRARILSYLALSYVVWPYLASAGLFGLAATYAAHPDLNGLANGAAGRLWQATRDVVRLGEGATLPANGKAAAVTIAIAPPGPDDGLDSRLIDLAYAASATLTILPDLPPAGPRLVQPRAPSAHAPRFDVASSAPPPVIPAPPTDVAPLSKASARAIAVSQRLRKNLTPEMLKHFDLFLYISKAARGPLAQRMYVFRKQDGKLTLLYDWPASTGREKHEVSPRGHRTFTSTPGGYYELDPDRMYRRYHSRAWNGAMPYAMFLNWERRGRLSGVAIHGTNRAGIARLGRRASAGCIHLSPRNAHTLYKLIRSEYRGQVPRFAYDARTRTMSNDGTLMRDADGHLTMADGYKVLVRIEDYAGNSSVAALL